MILDMARTKSLARHRKTHLGKMATELEFKSHQGLQAPHANVS
jgi:hypothetical protein